MAEHLLVIYPINILQSANGVMVNDCKLKALIPRPLKNGDRISIPSTKHAYVWIYQILVEEVIKDGAISPRKYR